MLIFLHTTRVQLGRSGRIGRSRRPRLRRRRPRPRPAAAAFVTVGRRHSTCPACGWCRIVSVCPRLVSCPARTPPGPHAAPSAEPRVCVAREEPVRSAGRGPGRVGRLELCGMAEGSVSVDMTAVLGPGSLSLPAAPARTWEAPGEVLLGSAVGRPSSPHASPVLTCFALFCLLPCFAYLPASLFLWPSFSGNVPMASMAYKTRCGVGNVNQDPKTTRERPRIVPCG